jgi:hypothetical protein
MRRAAERPVLKNQVSETESSDGIRSGRQPDDAPLKAAPETRFLVESLYSTSPGDPPVRAHNAIRRKPGFVAPTSEMNTHLPAYQKDPLDAFRFGRENRSTF